MTSFEPKDCSIQQLQALLSSAVAPRPIALASTIDAQGNPNLSPFSFFNISNAVMTDFNSIDQEKLDLVARGGGSYYIRAKQGFLEIPKPLRTLGIGVDMLPEAVRKSSILSGNDLGILANIEALPSQDSVKAFWSDPNQAALKSKLKTTADRHLKAKEFLNTNEVQKLGLCC